MHNASLDPNVVYSTCVIGYTSTHTYQKQNTSLECVVAGVIMVLADRGVTVTYRDTLQALAPQTNGVKIGKLVENYIKMKAPSLSPIAPTSVSLAGVKGSLMRGKTVLVGISGPFGDHAVVVDGITTDQGKMYFLIRDPDSRLDPKTYGMEESVFSQYYSAGGQQALLFL